MHLRHPHSRLLAFASATLVSIAAHSHPTSTRLDFSGSMIGNPGTFNGAPNVFDLFHGSLITGSFLFDVNALPMNPGNPDAVLYANTIDAFTFLAEAKDSSSFGYTYVNIASAYGVVQFYVNAVQGGFSDVFTSNFYAAPGSFSPTALDFADLGGGIPAWGEWAFQRYDFASNQTVQYRGAITAFKFTSVGAAPMPASQVPIPATWMLMVLGGAAFVASRRVVRG